MAVSDFIYSRLPVLLATDVGNLEEGPIKNYSHDLASIDVKTDHIEETPDLAQEFKGPPIPKNAIALCICWVLPTLLYLLMDKLVRKRKRVVKQAETADSDLSTRSLPDLSGDDTDCLLVMCASLEHSLPHLPKAKVVAGGLGKVMDLVSRHHPTSIFMVHPMVEQGDAVNYGDIGVQEEPLHIKVNRTHEIVKVTRQTSWPSGPDGPRVEFLLLSHPLFEERTKESIYPEPMSRHRVLAFFSLWNQAVGMLLARHKPDVYHCPDFHTAVAPWYALSEWKDLKVLLVLHNAEYQGSISTDMINGSRLKRMADIWNLPVEMVKKHLVHDGRFNMLKAVVNFIKEHQAGVGCCAVSQYYAAECHSMYSILWQLPRIDGLDNPMLEAERAKLDDSLQATKAAAKKEIQELFGLDPDPEARIFVSLGRLVRQKGVDLLADIAPWLLDTFPKAQMILVGPIGDGFGQYAASKLNKLSEDPKFKGRAFVKCEFLRVPEALKFGADFCLMPSRDEPFGYVDIEFAWRGTVLVGAQAGGLGKVPGFYYVAQNRENLSRSRKEIKSVVSKAMKATPGQLAEMAAEAMKSDFPLEIWKRRLMKLYGKLVPGLACVQRSEADAREVELTDLNEDLMQGREKASNRSEQGNGKASTRKRLGALLSKFSKEPGYLKPTVEARKSTTCTNANFDAINVGMLSATSFHQRAEMASEFLVQELSEVELSERVVAKLSCSSAKDIDTIMDEIGTDVAMERAKNSVERWLIAPTLGIKRIHWCVSCGYMASPVAAFLSFVTATNWGYTAGLQIPHYMRVFPWYDRVFAHGGLDPPLMNMILFTVNNLASAIGAPIWARLSQTVEPRLLLASSMLLQVPLLLTILPVQPTLDIAVLLVFIQGLITSGGLMYVVFNFLMTIKSDLSHAAVRIGVLEMVKYCVTWCIIGYVFVAQPSADDFEDFEETRPYRISSFLLPIGILVLLMTATPGILFLFAPGPYRGDRLPGWDLELIGKSVTFTLLSLSDCLGSFAMFPGTCYIVWWFANGWTTSDMGWLSVLFAVLLAVSAGLWYILLWRALSHGSTLLVGVALLLAPPSLLRAVAQAEVSTFTFYGRSEMAMTLIVISIFLEGVRSSAIWTMKVKVLGSRWRLLSYGSLYIAASHVFSAVSPYVCELLARQYGVSLITQNQKELADAVIACLVPIGVAQFALQLLVLPFTHKELGLSVQTERGTDQRWTRWLLRRSPMLIALVTGTALGIALLLCRQYFVEKEMNFRPLHRCSNRKVPNASTCKLISKETAPCAATYEDRLCFGRNKNGRRTTGRYNCHDLARKRGLANTFIFDGDEGRCEVYQCRAEDDAVELVDGTKQDGTRQIQGDGLEVWSYHCSMSGQDHVGVHLFEWRWEDVAIECREYLGPAGFSFVQVSPPQEHVLGPQWFYRYQPVSYLLESRGGTKQEFEEMVKACGKAGVAVMADVVLNHMAPPLFVQGENKGKKCGGEKNDPNQSMQNCTGWAYTTYGSREFPKIDDNGNSFTRTDFHHHLFVESGNCALPPMTNNRYLCDLFGMPDLDTEAESVKHILQEYLKVLYDIGVTMIRVDAGAHIYPSSLAQILEPFPWDYIVQEMYPTLLKYEHETKTKAMIISPITDMLYGQRLIQGLIDSWHLEYNSDGEAVGGHWSNRTKHLQELMDFDQETRSCEYVLCDSPLPHGKALVFLDNHDRQRLRWKEKPADEDICHFDGISINDCVMTYKHGLEYLQAMLYMLAYPYGDSVRVMSSYAFFDHGSGPPGSEQPDGRGRAERVHTKSGSKCRSPPSTSPVLHEYDNDTERRWVCEHRWPGVAGLVRFRRLMGRWRKVKRKNFFQKEGVIAFSLDHEGFVALKKGWSWYTRVGTNESFDLTGIPTELPPGNYCNLALESERVPPNPNSSSCPERGIVVIDINRSIANGTISSGGFVALHVNYQSTR